MDEIQEKALEASENLREALAVLEMVHVHGCDVEQEDALHYLVTKTITTARQGISEILTITNRRVAA